MKTEMLAHKSNAESKASLFAPFRKAGREAGLVTYSVSATNGLANEKRREQRRRTRLRAGKILDRNNRFLADATILDRSCGGLRLHLARDVEITDPFHFFDDEIESIFIARIAWRNRLILGVRRGASVVAAPRLIVSLRGKFYAMPD